MMSLLRLCILMIVHALLAVRNDATAQCMNWSNAFLHGPTGTVWDMIGFDDGSGPALYVTGDFLGIYSEQGHNSPFIYRWNGSQWQDVGLGLQDMGSALGIHDDGTGPKLYVAGMFTSAGTNSALNVAKWTGTDFERLGNGLYNPNITQVPVVQAFQSFNDGGGPAMYAIGQFTHSGNTPVYALARWNGWNWSAVGSGLESGSIGSIHVFDDGTGPALYIAGIFTLVGTTEPCKVAKWNGSVWAPLPNSNSLGIGLQSMATFDDGSGPALYVASGSAGQDHGVSKWTGTDWVQVGSGFGTYVYSLAVYDDGTGPTLFAGGSFSVNPGRYVAKWTGAAWVQLGGGTSATVRSLCTYGFGSGADLYAAGNFLTVGGGLSSRHVAAWQGCKTPMETFCYGNPSFAACPCSNSGLSGRGCQNSASTGGAALSSSGTTSPDTLVIDSLGLLPNATTLFFQGSVVSTGNVVFGDGLRCVTGGISRLAVKFAQAGQASFPEAGDPSISARSAALGDVLTPGSTRYYQAWYRDPNPGFCTSSTFNTSNGLRVVW